MPGNATDTDTAAATGLIDRLRAALGPSAVLNDPDRMAPYAQEWRGRFASHPVAVLRPDSTAAVAQAVTCCAAAGIAIVPQGGNTGLVGGAVAGADRPSVILNLSRLNTIRAFDRANDTITVDAGCILQQVQDAAIEADRLFPLSLGAEGSCQIGGVISTNAGGVMTIRYGNMRDLVLGLEVVLPDGQVLDGLNSLRKNNTGYDLKQLFIGAEGTLGIVTAAVLKLFPRPRQQVTTLVALDTAEAALDLYGHLRAACGDALFAYELMPRMALDLASAHLPDIPAPFSDWPAWLVLLETSTSADAFDLRALVEDALANSVEDGVIRDAVLAESEAQRLSFWRLREAMPEISRTLGGSLHHDLSVPVSRVPGFLADGVALVDRLCPGARAIPFGHLGDGNIHFNFLYPEGGSAEGFLARGAEIGRALHDLTRAAGGSMSAEHGIGLLKRRELAETADPVALDVMRRVKATLDPAGIMNPGKVV